ncbi:hypothetical protein DY000_02045458 [Brassica cretica]|uniref:ACT domain-containing protein n=1 Tax=Brassica cretica TaxID=69181 RepID=A0ABQ7EP48_BRACR|nr:hypothetical protein DY000_02045458 [Brassica cretica]
MKNTEESESSGSRAVVAPPSQENPRRYRMKLDVFGEVLQRLQESSYEEAALPDFEDRLWQHFNRLPARYAFDVNVERAEDVLTHLRLLKLAEDPATRPAFEVRNVQVSQSSSKPHGKGVVLSTPTFGSSPNFEAIMIRSWKDRICRTEREGEMTKSKGRREVIENRKGGRNDEEQREKRSDRDVDSAVNATLATRPMHEITFSTIHKPKLLSQLTSLLSELGLNIQEAHAFSTADGFSLNVFVVAGWSQEETDGLKDALGNEILKLKKLITKTQQTFDRALSTLPVTQHAVLLKSGRGLEAAENLIDVLSRVGEVGILWTSTVEHLICVLREWAQMELRHMNLRSDTAGPSVEFRQRATDTDMEDSVPVRIGMGGKARSGRRKIKSVSNKPATMSTKKYTPDDQEWPSDLPEHFVDICKDWRNTPFIIRPAAYQGLLDLCWAVCINRSVESAFNLLDDGREPVRLSAQHLVNGVHKHESGHITHFDGVRDFMKRHGMVPEASCPWTGKVDNV